MLPIAVPADFLSGILTENKGAPGGKNTDI